MNFPNNTVDMLKFISSTLWDLDYRFTGLTAVNLYGYGIDTNVFDIAVNSDEAVENACELLRIPFDGSRDPYVFKGENFYIRVQGDILGEPFVHPLNLKLHNKEQLVRRLEIYCLHDASILKACAWIALTKTDEFAEKYKYYWNRI
jgi:hypothetical protein